MEAAVSVPQVVEYLEQLVAALKSGAVHVHAGGQELVLGPRDVLGLKLRARQKGKRQKLALELTWRKKQLAPETGLGLEFRAAPPESAPEAIEVVDLADATKGDSDGGAGQEHVDSTDAATTAAATAAA
ncbi:MAG: amphi-Trp domain-containing protein, partial [Nannocystis sp.]